MTETGAPVAPVAVSGYGVTVAVDVPAGLAAELARCRPYLEIGPLSRPARVRVGWRPLAGCRTGPAAGPTRPVELHQGHRGRAGDDRLVHNDTLGLHYHVVAGVRPDVVICGRDEPAHRLDLIQVVRGLVLGAARADGWRPAHAAALEIDGRGVLLVGPKAAGKTSFALAALRADPERVALVTNDKGLFDPADGATVAGLPFAAAVAPGTLGALPGLARPGDRWSAGKLLLWPVELADRLGIALSRATRVDEVWWCGLDLAAGDVTSTPLLAAERAGAIRDVLDFSYRMSPVWLWDRLGWPAVPADRSSTVPAALADADWYRVTGNPWTGWNPGAVTRTRPAAATGAVAAVSFDGDGTLWDFETTMRLALEEAAQRFAAAGLSTAGGPVTGSWLREVRDEVAGREDLRGGSMEQIRHAAFAEAVRRCGGADGGFVRDIYEQYMLARFQRLLLFDDARAALLAVRRAGLRTALITNGNTTPVRAGLAGQFDVTVVAQECGLRKPDPEIYRLAVGRLRLAADRCLHVGDDPVEDVLAARRAGLRTAWLDRTGAPWPLGDAAGPVLNSLAGLPGLVSRLNRQGRSVPAGP
jgi:HAD superfamily hydrolase (TIGR01549 family)